MHLLQVRDSLFKQGVLVYSQSRFTLLTFLLGSTFTGAFVIKRAQMLLKLSGLLLEPPHFCSMQDHCLTRVVKSKFSYCCLTVQSDEMQLSKFAADFSP